MKLTKWLFFLFGFTNLYSQNINLNQLLNWRNTNYNIADKELLKNGWKKSISKEPIDNYRNDEYFLNKGSIKETVLTLNYTNDNNINNNCLSYSTLKDNNYDDFINQVKSSGFTIFRSDKKSNIYSDYYKSELITVIVSVINGIDEKMQEINFVYIYLSTNEDYEKSHYR